MISFFEVIWKKVISLKLQLPQAMNIHNIIYLNLLQKTSTNLLIDQVNEPVPPVIIDNEKD